MPSQQPQQPQHPTAFTSAAPLQLQFPTHPLTSFFTCHQINPANLPTTTNSRHLKACLPHSNPHSHSLPSHSHKTPSPHTLPNDLYSIDVDAIENDPATRLRSFIKVRASLDPTEQVVYTFTGTVHGALPGTPEKTRPLFRLRGLSVARAVPTDTGYRLLTREVAFYTPLPVSSSSSSSSSSSDDDQHQQDVPLSSWHNPYTDETVPVVHVWNDPVNQDLLPGSPISARTLGSSDRVAYSVDVFPKYPSPLGGMYESSELFSFFVPRAELTDPCSTTNSVSLSWTRVGQWLPWMQMDNTESNISTNGRLIYHCQGHRESTVPLYFQHWIETLNPMKGAKFLEAPWEVSTPNETSWSYMKKLIENKPGFPRADGRVAPPETPAPIPQKEKEKDVHLFLNEAQLKAFAGGADNSVPIYLSVAGRIFNVSAARRHYGAGQTYNCLTGRDTSKALLLGKLRLRPGATQPAATLDDDATEQEEDIDLTDLHDEQLSTLREWVKFFADRYPTVGTLLDFQGPSIEL